MSEHIDGHNKVRVTREGSRVRIDCFQQDIHNQWRHVYGGLHPESVLVTSLESETV
ncbi:hypothetical protein P3H15_27425 [Rhodococcus sp. T2V]|uniref:hypothetical protein n=1 Tax=Rhodococcus sp. T2V TaxID=3034164 RepID=UPI0023E2F260|nr:hypothetical protein [Rhodococcus sp. T2V]MDF3308754.1 hypothetical protein [Rhodococcus sp. T2V]